MSNTFVSLPAPAANGSGAAVDVSALAGSKSIVAQGLAGAFVQVEYSNDPAHLVWAPSLPQFTKNGIQNVTIACKWMRATVLNYSGGGAPVVAVGASDTTATFGEIVPPAGNGVGAAVDTSAMPGFKTIQISGGFTGAINIEASENGGANYATVASFSPGSVQQSWTGVVYADRMRINRSGCGPTPGLPVCYIGATELGGSQDGGSQTYIYNLLADPVQTDYPGGSDAELYRTLDLGSPRTPPKPTESLSLDLRGWVQIQWDDGAVDQVVDVKLKIMYYFGGGAATRTFGHFLYTPPAGTALKAGKQVIYCQGIMTNGHYTIDPAPMSLRLETAVGSVTVYIPAYGSDVSYPYAGMIISAIPERNTHERRPSDSIPDGGS